MSEYKSGDVQRLFDISDETVRQWAMAFSDYLSPLANPGIGRHRLFSLDDLQVFSLVADMKSKGFTYDDIKLSLANGQRGEVPDIDSTTTFYESGVQLDIARQEIEELRAIRQHLHDENIRLKTQLEDRENRIAELEAGRSKLDELNQQIASLNRELGKLEAKIELLQDK